LVKLPKPLSIYLTYKFKNTTTMELSKEKINEIAAMLKDADGEDVQNILITSGWNDQMLKQLMMTEPLAEVQWMMKERLSFEEDMKRKYWVFESC
jgi:hypothetical protein